MQPTPASGQAMDPISAIANAVGDIFKSVSSVLVADQQEDIEYQRWLAETFPEYKWFFRHERRQNNSWIWIVVLAVLIIAVVAATVWSKKKKK